MNILDQTDKRLINLSTKLFNTHRKMVKSMFELIFMLVHGLFIEMIILRKNFFRKFIPDVIVNAVMVRIFFSRFEETLSGGILALVLVVIGHLLSNT